MNWPVEDSSWARSQPFEVPCIALAILFQGGFYYNNIKMHFFSALRFGFKVYQISGWVAVAVHQILTKSTPEWRTLDLDLIPIFFGFVQNALCFLHQRDLLHSGLTSRKDKWTILFSSSTNLQRLWNTVFHFNDLIVINCIKFNDLIVINGKRINGHADSAALGRIDWGIR